MNRLILLIIISFYFLNKGYSQQDAAASQRNQQKADSAVAARMIQKMQALFTVSVTQQQSLKAVTVEVRRNRKAVFTENKKTPDLHDRMLQQEQAEDAAYQSIVGEKNYTLYKNAVLQYLEQKKSAMAERVRIKFGTIDTTTIKPKAHEK